VQSKFQIDEPWREIFLQRKEESFKFERDGSRREREWILHARIFLFFKKKRDFTLLSNYKNLSSQKSAYQEIGQYIMFSNFLENGWRYEKIISWHISW